MDEGQSAGAGNEDRFEEAARWFVKLRSTQNTDLTPDELSRWQQFASDQQNLAAFETVQRAASVGPRMRRPVLPSAQELASDRFDGSMSVSTWRRTHGNRWSLGRSWIGRNVVRAGTLVASVALVTVVAWMLLQETGTRSSDEFAGSFTTNAGQVRDIDLPDGSKISLGALTLLSANYSRPRRMILLERGEALFTVAHNRNRPFQVRVGGGTVTAVGTQFHVKRSTDRVTVTVTDGTVDVSPLDVRQIDTTGDQPRSVPPIPPARVSKGQQLSFEEGGAATPAEPADLEQATAWREGRLEYRRVPLKYVVADVNRYFSRQILLGDPAVGELEFTGTVFQHQSVDEWLRTLESIFDVRVARTDAHRILIQSSAPDPVRAERPDR